MLTCSVIRLKNQNIPVFNETKFLGIFGNLTFKIKENRWIVDSASSTISLNLRLIPIQKCCCINQWSLNPLWFMVFNFGDLLNPSTSVTYNHYKTSYPSELILVFLVDSLHNFFKVDEVSEMAKIHYNRFHA